MLLRVKTPFATATRVYPAGTLVDSTDPVAKGNEVHMELAEADAVEQATAAPGEKRTVTRARKAPAKKATAES